jgi:hypothetical protein
MGPSWSAIALRVAATSSAKDVNGFCTEVTRKAPASSETLIVRLSIMLDPH